MSDEGFVILDPIPASTPRLEPPATPEPPPYRGRTWDDFTPEQKARFLRFELTPYFYEPVYDEKGTTGVWRVGKVELHKEITVKKVNSEAEAKASVKELLLAWRTQATEYSRQQQK